MKNNVQLNIDKTDLQILDTNDIMFIQQQIADILVDNANANALERISDMLTKQQIIKGFDNKPKQLSGKDKRWFLRPYNHDRTCFKAQTKDKVIEKALNWVLKQQTTLTLLDCLTAYIKFRSDLSPATHHHWTCEFNRFASKLLNSPISSIKASDIVLCYRDALKDKNVPKKASNNFKGTLRSTLEYARDELNQKVLDIDKLFKELNRTNDLLFAPPKAVLLIEDYDDIYTKDEFKAVRDLIKQKPDLINLAILFIFYTGLRIGELLALHREDIDLEKGVVYVRRSIHKYPDKDNEHKFIQAEGLPKKNKMRNVVLPTEGIKVAKALLERSKLTAPDSVYLLPSEGTKALTPHLTQFQIYRRLEELCKESNTITKSPHDIRRSYISYLDSAGVPMAVRYALVGHSLTGIDKNYLRNIKDVNQIRTMLDNVYQSLDFTA